MKNKLKVTYTTRNSVREKFVLWLLEKVAPFHYQFCSARTPWGYNSDQLLTFPAGSLGQTLGVFYKTEKFEPIAKAERHDVFHVLLGYTTEVSDEAAMQFFLLGNGKLSVFTFGTAFIALALFPFQYKTFIKAYKKGKESVDISGWDFKKLLAEDISHLKQIIFKVKA